MSIKQSRIISTALGLALGYPLATVSQTPVSSEAAARPPAAQQRTASGLVLEEVLVTVSKRQESVQDVPASVAPLSASLLRELHILTIRDVANIIPNIVAKTPRS